jgi:hypothetical protein
VKLQILQLSVASELKIRLSHALVVEVIIKDDMRHLIIFKGLESLTESDIP